MPYTYFITIKILNKLKPQHHDYSEIVGLLPLTHNMYVTHEYDSNDKLHYHIVYESKKKWNYEGFKISGCSIHTRLIKNKMEMFYTMKYLHKDYVNKVDHTKSIGCTIPKSYYLFSSDEEDVVREAPERGATEGRTPIKKAK